MPELQTWKLAPHPSWTRQLSFDFPPTARPDWTTCAFPLRCESSMTYLSWRLRLWSVEERLQSSPEGMNLAAFRGRRGGRNRKYHISTWFCKHCRLQALPSRRAVCNKVLCRALVVEIDLLRMSEPLPWCHDGCGDSFEDGVCGVAEQRFCQMDGLSPVLTSLKGWNCTFFRLQQPAHSQLQELLWRVFISNRNRSRSLGPRVMAAAAVLPPSSVVFVQW